MPFPPSFLDDVVARNPIEDVVGQYVTMQRRGSNLFGLCPFHGEKTASFSVAPEKGIYYCFGCHKGGGVINFIMEIENLSYPDAVRFLAKRAGLEVPEDPEYQSRYRKQERLWALCQEAARFFHGTLYSPARGGRTPVRRAPGPLQGHPHPVWSGLCPQPLGRTPHCHEGQGVQRGGAAGVGTRPAQREKRQPL